MGRKGLLRERVEKCWRGRWGVGALGKCRSLMESPFFAEGMKGSVREGAERIWGMW